MARERLLQEESAWEGILGEDGTTLIALESATATLDLYPEADFAAGSWTLAPLYQRVDDGLTYNDTDYIYTTTSFDTISFVMSNPGAGAASTGNITLTVRATSTVNAEILSISITESGTARGSADHALTTSMANYTCTANISLFTDVNNLRVEMYPNTITGSVAVAWVSVTLPAASVGGVKMLTLLGVG